MTTEVNAAVVGDTARLMMHRLIVRMIRRDPSLIERAKIAHARQADQFAGWPLCASGMICSRFPWKSLLPN